MLNDLLYYLEAEVVKRDPRITGLEKYYSESNQNRLQLIITVRQQERQEIRLPVTVSLDDMQAGNLSRVTGAILQAVDLYTWGPRDNNTVRDGVSVTA